MKFSRVILIVLTGCGGAEFTSTDALFATDGGADADTADASSDASSEQSDSSSDSSSPDAELRDSGTVDSGTTPDSNACVSFDGGRVMSSSCGNADVPVNFRSSASVACQTIVTPSACQCVATYTCACILANFVHSGSTTACPGNAHPMGCSWDGTLLVLMCP